MVSTHRSTGADITIVTHSIEEKDAGLRGLLRVNIGNGALLCVDRATMQLHAVIRCVPLAWVLCGLLHLHVVIRWTHRTTVSPPSFGSCEASCASTPPTARYSTMRWSKVKRYRIPLGHSEFCPKLMSKWRGPLCITSSSCWRPRQVDSGLPAQDAQPKGHVTTHCGSLKCYNRAVVPMAGVVEKFAEKPGPTALAELSKGSRYSTKEQPYEVCCKLGDTHGAPRHPAVGGLLAVTSGGSSTLAEGVGHFRSS